MNQHQLAVVCLLGIGAAMALYFAVDSTNGTGHAPLIQGEGQMMGMGVRAGLAYNEGTPLDIRPEVHFWAPGYNPRDSDGPNQVVKSRHKYPVVPGGNISTVMHNGWSSLCDKQPEENDWFYNPPEAAVL